MDEPAANLDPEARKIFFDLLAERLERCDDDHLQPPPRRGFVAGQSRHRNGHGQGRPRRPGGRRCVADRGTLACRIVLKRFEPAFAKALDGWNGLQQPAMTAWSGPAASPAPTACASSASFPATPRWSATCRWPRRVTEHVRRCIAAGFIGRLGLGGLLLTPLAAALSGCQKGQLAGRHGRDQVGPRYLPALQHGHLRPALRRRRCVAARNMAFKFDDIGCMVLLASRKKPRSTRGWPRPRPGCGWPIQQARADEMTWLDPRKAPLRHPQPRRWATTSAPSSIRRWAAWISPSMRQHVLAKGK